MIRLVALDADDTLWHNEPLYRGTERQFREMLMRYEAPGVIEERLYETERRNLEHFGYGVKGFTLSMIETAIELTDGRITSSDIRTLIDWGRTMLASPVELLEGVRETVEAIAADFPLILLTKGDLLHQESKLARSGLGEFFSGVEIVSEKEPTVYRRVMRRYEVEPEAFVMVGNSLKSDILPVLDAGGHAVYVPYEICWVHERVEPAALHGRHFHEIPRLTELPGLLREMRASAPQAQKS